MATTAKARQISGRLAEVLRVRTTLALAEGIGTSGDPTINIGAGSVGGANAFIRVIPLAVPLAKDSLGLTQQGYAQHVVQLATEANEAGTTDNIVDNLSRAQLSAILGEAIQMGCNVEWYEEAKGTAPIETTITGSKLKATFNANAYYPLSNQ
jgi:hypothetical protein